MYRLCLPLLLVLCCPVLAENWPGWRGPTGQGISTAKELPLQWSEKSNVKWKTALPDTGNGSPVVWGKRIFITQATDKGKKRGVMCFDRDTGKLLWHRTIAYDEKESTHETNPYGSATPVTDGEVVITSLGSAGLVCYDFAGKQLWHRALGKMEHIWGNASSPILHGGLAIIWCGPGENQRLVAVNKKTGAIVWKHDEPGGKSGVGSGFGDWVGSWSTPVIARIGDHDELLLCVPYKLKAFNPKTGKELWSCDGLGPLAYTTPVVSSEGVVLALSGFYGPGLAVKAGGSGDVTKMRLWQLPRPNPQRIGSAVVVGEHAYLINEPGLGQCFELKTGKDLWKRARVTSVTWGSLVHAAGRLYVTNNRGETVVLAASPKLEVLARNRLDDRVMASIAVADSELFIRGYKHLYCIAEKKK